jgi:hypothetical protein
VNGTMGVGGTNSFPAQYGAHIKNSALTGTNIYGAVSEVTGPATATVSINAFSSVPTTSANAFTVGIVRGFQAINAIKGVGSTITNQHGVWVADQTEGTNNFGITSLVSSGTNKWNIYASGTAANYFAGDVLIGTSSAAAYVYSSGRIQLAGTTEASSVTSLARFSANSGSPILNFAKSRGASVGANTVVQSGDDLGLLAFVGADGTNYIEAARIRAQVDGTPGTNDMPGRLVFSTTADGASSPTERMRLDSAGNLGLGVTPSASWWASTKSIGIGRLGNGVFGATGDDEINIGANVINTGSGTYIYGATDTASLYRQVAAQHVWYYAASGTAGAAMTLTEAMRIDSSGNVGIGTSSPATGVHLNRASGNTYYRAQNNLTNADFGTDGAGTGILWNNGNYPLAFGTNNTERARIDSSGNVAIGKTDAGAFSTAGIQLRADGDVGITRSGGAPLSINRLTNDGNLVEFYQATTLEGSISVSGTTVSYNGGHLSRWAQTADNAHIELLKGTVMSNLDQMAEWIDPETGEPLPNEQLNCMKVSDVEGDVNVAGVFVNWDNDDDVFANDMNVAMTGDMIIRIAQGVTVQRGDLLMSAGDGTAKPQGDDIIRSKTVAKVTSTHVTCTYEDGSYCVPCVLMAC